MPGMDATTPEVSDRHEDLKVLHEQADPRLAASSTAELLALYGSILTVLRERGITRSENSPVGDYAEHLASIAFGLTLVNNSSIGYDGVDADGVRYQVKGRRITRRNPSRQLSAIRGLATEGDPFDVLLGILFDGEFRIWRAALVPLSVVKLRAKRQEHVNAWRLMLTEPVWTLPGVTDVTKRVRAAAERLEGVPRELHQGVGAP
jgi:hypothetical protein